MSIKITKRARPNTIGVRLSPDELALVQAKAKAAGGITLAAFLRESALADAQIKPQDQSARIVEEAVFSLRAALEKLSQENAILRAEVEKLGPAIHDSKLETAERAHTIGRMLEALNRQIKASAERSGQDILNAREGFSRSVSDAVPALEIVVRRAVSQAIESILDPSVLEKGGPF